MNQTPGRLTCIDGKVFFEDGFYYYGKQEGDQESRFVRANDVSVTESAIVEFYERTAVLEGVAELRVRLQFPSGSANTESVEISETSSIHTLSSNFDDTTEHRNGADSVPMELTPAGYPSPNGPELMSSDEDSMDSMRMNHREVSQFALTARQDLVDTFHSSVRHRIHSESDEEALDITEHTLRRRLRHIRNRRRDLEFMHLNADDFSDSENIPPVRRRRIDNNGNA